MRPPEHRITAEAFAALATGAGGADTVHALAGAQYSKHVLLVWGVMDRSRATGHPQAGQARQGYELLADIQRHAPAATEAVLRHPAVGGWADRTLRALDADNCRPSPDLVTSAPGQPWTGNASAGLAGRAGPPGEPAQLAALAAAAALHSGYSCTIEAPVRRGVLTLPSAGQVVGLGQVPGGMATVRCTPGRTRVVAGDHVVEIPADIHRDAPAWRGLRAIRATAGELTLRLLIDDLDPFRMPAATAALRGRLEAAEVTHWQAALRDAWGLLANQPTGTAAEITAAIRVLTPLRPPAHGHLSASSREVFGSVALSAPSRGHPLAVTLAHEVQHAKMSALLDLVALVQADDGRRYYAPWRDDPRPLSGLVHGAYAYLGVTGFWRWQRHQETGAAALRGHAEFARWRDAATRTAEIALASDGLTQDGTSFVTGMLSTLRGWADEAVPAAALAQARRDSQQHWARWQRRNGGISAVGARPRGESGWAAT